MTWKNKYPFTLLEIILTTAILGIAAVYVGFQLSGLLKTHHFHQNIEQWLTDLKKCQIIALANEVDIEMKMVKIGDSYSYQLHCDSPLPAWNEKPVKLKAIHKITGNTKTLEECILTIQRTGRIIPIKQIVLMSDEEKGYQVSFEKSPLIKVQLFNLEEETM